VPGPLRVAQKPFFGALGLVASRGAENEGKRAASVDTPCDACPTMPPGSNGLN